MGVGKAEACGSMVPSRRTLNIESTDLRLKLKLNSNKLKIYSSLSEFKIMKYIKNQNQKKKKKFFFRQRCVCGGRRGVDVAPRERPWKAIFSSVLFFYILFMYCKRVLLGFAI